jgi:hypothetical protein
MSIHRGLPHLFQFQLVRGFADENAASRSGKEVPRAANDVGEVRPVRGEAQAIHVLYQSLPDEAG